MKKKNLTLIKVLMAEPNATDERIAQIVGISRSAVAKRRAKLQREKAISYFVAPNLGKISRKLITGKFQFAPRIKYKDIEAFAKQFAKEERVISVWIRHVSKDTFGLCFQYLNYEGESLDKIIEVWKEKLTKKFGADVIGWDIAGSTYVLKFLGQKFKPSFF